MYLRMSCCAISSTKQSDGYSECRAFLMTAYPVVVLTNIHSITVTTQNSSQLPFETKACPFPYIVQFQSVPCKWNSGRIEM